MLSQMKKNFIDIYDEQIFKFCNIFHFFPCLSSYSVCSLLVIKILQVVMAHLYWFIISSGLFLDVKFNMHNRFGKGN